MPTDQFDAAEVLRAALYTWWTGQATLSTLGVPSMGGDDGSPASGPSETNPKASVRFGDASDNGITNKSKRYLCPVVFQVYDNTPEEAALAAKPLWKLLAKMEQSTAFFPALGEGYIAGVSIQRYTRTQLSTLLWRHECETEFEIILDRIAS